METESSETKSKSRSFFLTSLPFFILAHAAHHFLTALPQPLLPDMRDEFKLDYTKASLIPMSFAISGATGQLPAGWLADRLGPASLIAVGTIGVAMAGILIGFSKTFLMLILCLLLMGLLSGGYHPAATPLISASVKPQQRGRALGLHLIGGNSAFFVAPIMLLGFTALSVEMRTNDSTPFATAASASTRVPSTLLRTASRDHPSSIGTCLYAAA